MELKQNFIDWACSLSGCDGGSPDADIWISGIEWGGGDEDYYNNWLPQEIEKGKFTPPELYDWKDTLGFAYGRSFAKLYNAIIGEKVYDYKLVPEKSNGNEVLKLNLYPIAFRNTSDELWKKYRLDEITGFKEKEFYKTWCFLHRFPAIAELAKEKNPKLIIGTGITYLTDYFVCFAGASSFKTAINTGEIKPESRSNGPNRKYCWAKLNNNTILVVIPFFSGKYGLNSDYLLQEMGDRINKLIT